MKLRLCAAEIVSEENALFSCDATGFENPIKKQEHHAEKYSWFILVTRFGVDIPLSN